MNSLGPRAYHLRAILFAAWCTVAATDYASATSCSGATPTADQVLESETIFIGELVNTGRVLRVSACLHIAVAATLGKPAPDADCLPCAMEFKVIERFKGTVPDFVSVDILGAYQCPGPDQLREAAPDMQMLVYAHPGNGHPLAVGLCSGIVDAKAVPDLISDLRQHRTDVPEASER